MLAIVASLSSGALLMAATNAAHAEDNNKVDITLKGWVTAKCTVNGGNSVTTPVSIGNVNAAGEKSFTYPVNCNAPFRYTLSSTNGGLQRTQPLNGAQPTRVYNVNVNIPTDSGTGAGSGITINDTCASNTIRGNVITCPNVHDSGNDIALDKTATLKVTWSPDTALPSGTYADKLTFTVGLKH